MMIVNKNIEVLNNTSTFETIDSYLPYFYEKLETLFDYLKGYTFIIDDIKRCSGKLDSIYYEFNENYMSFLQRGDILPSQNKLLLNKDELLESLERENVIMLSSFLTKNNILNSYVDIGIEQKSLNSYNGQIELLVDDIKNLKAKKYKTIILAGTRARGERLVDTLRDREIEAVYKDTIDEVHSGEVVVQIRSFWEKLSIRELKKQLREKVLLK